MRFHVRFQRRNAKVIGIYVLRIAALALVYHLAARLGLQMAYVQINTSPVWPPTGIALAALLTFGYSLWPGISLGVLVGSMLTGAPFTVAAGMALGNTLEALIGAYILKRFIGFHNAMDRIQDVVGLALSSLLSTSVGASLGSLTLLLTGRIAWQSVAGIWSTWWIGDLLGALVVAPMLLVWTTLPPFTSKRHAYVEGGILSALLVAVTWYVFGSRASAGVFHQAMIYVIFPFVIWAALRLGQRGAATAVFVVSAIAIWGTSQGMGPFSLESKNDSLVLLQTFMGVVSCTSLVLAAAITERRKAADALRQRVEDLATLSDSSKAFLDTLDLASVYRTICRLAVTRLGADIAWIETESRTRGGHIAAAYGAPIETIPALARQWETASAHAALDVALTGTTTDVGDTAPGTDAARGNLAAFPLIFGNEPIGMLKMLSADASFFTPDRCLLAQSYANLAAVAIQNAWLFEEVRKGNQQLHALSQRLMRAQEEERLHLSRELHDESSQLLAALTMQLGFLERDVNRPEMLNQRIGELKRTANEIQDNLHRLAVNLRPASLDHLGLVTALRQYSEEFGRKYNIQTDFEAVGMEEGKRLPIETETALFRVVQESLTNVALHARATHVDVLISRRGSWVVATIEDDGIGFVVSPSIMENTLGLFGMRERLEMLGGRLTIESAPGKGTTVTAEVPLDDQGTDC